MTAPANAPGLRVVDLAVGYRGGAGRVSRRTHLVLEGLRLVAEPGAVTTLLGPNGSGKSTLLRTLACLQPALRGRVEIDGMDPRRMSPRQRARGLAVVLTDRFDPALLTGREVVSLGRHPHLGMSGSLGPTDRLAVAEALAVMRADHFADVRLAELSDGQRQRVMIARGLAQQPRLLVLDEPTAFLDAPGRIELLDRLRTVAAERNIAVVLSTHDVELALRSGGAAWLIRSAGDDSPAPGAGARTVTSGPIGRLARNGAINSAFDSDAVGFDPNAGTFRLLGGPADPQPPGRPAERRPSALSDGSVAQRS